MPRVHRKVLRLLGAALLRFCVVASNPKRRDGRWLLPPRSRTRKPRRIKIQPQRRRSDRTPPPHLCLQRQHHRPEISRSRIRLRPRPRSGNLHTGISRRGRKYHSPLKKNTRRSNQLCVKERRNEGAKEEKGKPGKYFLLLFF